MAKTISCDSPDCSYRYTESGSTIASSESYADDDLTFAVSIYGRQVEFRIKKHQHLCNKCLEKIQNDVIATMLNNPSIERTE